MIESIFNSMYLYQQQSIKQYCQRYFKYCRLLSGKFMQTSPFEFALTKKQVKQLNRLLPQGFIFVTPTQYVKLAKFMDDNHPQEGANQQPKQQVLVSEATRVIISKLFNRMRIHPFAKFFLKLSTQAQEMWSKIELKIKSIKSYGYDQLTKDLDSFIQFLMQIHGQNDINIEKISKLNDYLKISIKKQKEEDEETIIEYNEKLNEQTKNQQYEQSHLQNQTPFKPFNPIDKKIAKIEKIRLSINIRNLSSQQIEKVCWILFKNVENKYFSIDLDKMNRKQFIELQKSVRGMLQQKWINNVEVSSDEDSDENWQIENDQSD